MRYCKSSVSCKMNTAFHSVQYCSNTMCYALNDLQHPYYMPFDRLNGADQVECVGDTMNLILFLSSRHLFNAVLN